MNRIFNSVFLFFCFFSCLFFNNISAQSACLDDLELNFFEAGLVHQSLSIYRIPQGLWSPISQDLTTRSTQIPVRMHKATARMVPNPLSYPMQKGIVAKILKEILQDVFYETMSKYQVNERPTADFAFDYIFAEQLPKFINCFGEEARKLAPSFE